MPPSGTRTVALRVRMNEYLFVPAHAHLDIQVQNGPNPFPDLHATGKDEVNFPMQLNVYMAGEIHTDWRENIIAACEGLAIEWYSPVTDHAASDDCGVEIFGAEDSKFWHDRKGASLNAVRTRTAIAHSDVVVVCFGEKYKQWNAAFDAGYAAALGKPLIVLQLPEHDHALKEIDAAANAVARTPSEVARALKYVVAGKL